MGTRTSKSDRHAEYEARVFDERVQNLVREIIRHQNNDQDPMRFDPKDPLGKAVLVELNTKYGYRIVSDHEELRLIQSLGEIPKDPEGSDQVKMDQLVNELKHASFELVSRMRGRVVLILDLEKNIRTPEGNQRNVILAFPFVSSETNLFTGVIVQPDLEAQVFGGPVE